MAGAIAVYANALLVQAEKIASDVRKAITFDSNNNNNNKINDNNINNILNWIGWLSIIIIID